ncbi:MAG: trehalase family glycosidase [Lentisphaeria bacterium]|nr:trehalase family glycosidase [Lentisphaeria bacterium]
MRKHISNIRENLSQNYKGMFREAGGALPYPFLTPGSDQYADVLWDWDSWLTNVALRQILKEFGTGDDREEARKYERGCVRNFLADVKLNGWVPISIPRSGRKPPEDIYAQNMHKPCLAQHAAFLVQQDGGDAEWVRDKEGLYGLQKFVNNYRNFHRHACGVYFWQDDSAVGVDNDPCSFDRPPRSCGSIYLNCLMFRELEALAYLCECVDLGEVAAQYQKDADDLKAAILEYCWDERDGFFYSVDFNFVDPTLKPRRHGGQKRDWPCLIQRIGVWSGFLALWSGVATKEQAERVIAEHYRNDKTFNAPAGVRTLSKMEKMYNVRASGGPSSWLGPIWGVSNYLTFRGLVRYGFDKDAKDLAEKTIRLFGRDIERFGGMHEYYQPENGEPILNLGFQNWNYLVLNMIAWLEGQEPVTEF